MSEAAKKLSYTVTFGDFKDGHNIPHHTELPFKIEPPLTVYSPDFIQKAINRLYQAKGRRGSAFAISRIANNATVTHSTSQATHGTIEGNYILPFADTKEGESVIEGSNIARAEFKEFVSQAFEAAISPMGDAELNMVFLGDHRDEQ